MIVDGKAPEVRERRMLKACEPCRLRRTKCEDTRPCSSCVFRGLDCSEEVKAPEESCSLCKRKKLYCDKERPCRCLKTGYSNPPAVAFSLMLFKRALDWKPSTSG
eukprot:2982712-Rhodomonas_salina.1